ncbi:MAG: septum formation initiator family protein [Acidobacteria bacterium]|nr:septum formation initiator family protein [Acidobacteriota bacterium]
MSARKPPSGGKSLRPVVGATLLTLLALLALGGVKSYRDLTLARERVRELEEQIRAAHERIESLKQEILQLKGDPNTIERRAREDLGLAKPGELVILLPDEEEEDPALKPEAPKRP